MKHPMKVSILSANIAFALLSAGCSRIPAGGLWEHAAPLPVAVAEVGVAASSGEIHVLGGTEQAADAEPQWSSSLHLAYNAAADRWRELAPLPQRLTHVGEVRSLRSDSTGHPAPVHAAVGCTDPFVPSLPDGLSSVASNPWITRYYGNPVHKRLRN